MIGLTQLRVIGAEWIKLRTLRSTLLVMAFAIGSMLLMGAAGAGDFNRDWEHASVASRGGLDPTPALLSGWFLAQVIVGVVGALAVTSEYASGSITATLSAAPRRTSVLVAKLLVPSIASFLVIVPAAIAGFLLGKMLLPAEVSIGLGDPGVLRAVICTGVAMAAVCVWGVSLGFILRSTAGTIAVLVVALVVLPPLLGGLSDELYRLLPSGALKSVVTVEPTPDQGPLLAWPAGLAVLAAYSAAAIGAAYWFLQRRDA